MNKHVYHSRCPGVRAHSWVSFCLAATVLVVVLPAPAQNPDMARDSFSMPTVPGFAVQPPLPAHLVPEDVMRQPDAVAPLNEPEGHDGFFEDDDLSVIQSYEPIGKGSNDPFGGYVQPVSQDPVDLVFGIQKLDQIVIGQWEWRNPRRSQDIARLHFNPDKSLIIENNEMPNQSGQWSTSGSTLTLSIENELVIQGKHIHGALHFDFPVDGGNRLFVFKRMNFDRMDPIAPQHPSAGDTGGSYVPSHPRNGYRPVPPPPLPPTPSFRSLDYPELVPQADTSQPGDAGIQIHRGILREDYRKAEAFAVALANEIKNRQNEFPQLQKFNINQHFVRNGIRNNLLPGSLGNPELFSINYHNGVLAMRNPDGSFKAASEPVFDPDDGIMMNIHIFNGPSRGQIAEILSNHSDGLHIPPFNISTYVRGVDSEEIHNIIKNIIRRLQSRY